MPALVTRALGHVAHSLMLSVVLASAMFLGVVGVGPFTGRYQVATVLSGSMRPTYPPGSLVFATKIRAQAVHVGHVLMYQIPLEDHRVVCHRVIAVRRSGPGIVVQTQGDANNGPDPWRAPLDGTVWRVRMGADDLGYVVNALRGELARLILGRVVPVLLAVVWLIAIWRPSPVQREISTPTPGAVAIFPYR